MIPSYPTEFFFSDKNSELKSQVADFLTSYSINPLIVYGNSGCGKTYLCKLIHKSFTDVGKNCRYISSEELKDIVRESVLGEETYDMTEYLTEFDVVIFDDIDDIEYYTYKKRKVANVISELVKKRVRVLVSGSIDFGELTDCREGMNKIINGHRIHFLNLEERKKYVQHRLENLHTPLDDGIIQKIAEVEKIGSINGILRFVEYTKQEQLMEIHEYVKKVTCGGQ